MDAGFWVFAYGSLVWNPGFRAAEKVPATIHGLHRAMCLLSYHYRGTRRAPGMVLGLDRGGACRGLALRVTGKDARRVRAYLDKREMLAGVYERRIVRAKLDDGRKVRAVAYVVVRDHEQYAGGLAPMRMAALIRRAKGVRGTARDYLANTVAHLESIGLGDRGLKRLLALVDRSPLSAR